jgi:membrane protein
VLKGISQLVSRTVEAWWADNAMRKGAALAYYTVFSLTPFLIVVIAVAGLVIDPGTAEQQIVDQIGAVVGPDAAVAIRGLLEGARRPGTGGIAAVTGLITITLGATAVFSELQSGLNEIWQVPGAYTGRLGIVRGLLRARLKSFALVLGIGFLFLVSLVLRAAAVALQTWYGSEILFTHDVLGLLLSALMFGMIFKILPETRVAWRDVIVGAVVTAVLFTLGQAALGRYLGTSGVGSVYGAAGSLVVTLVWVYYSAQVFFLGAEFTHVYATCYGSRAGTWECAHATDGAAAAAAAAATPTPAPAPVAARRALD